MNENVIKGKWRDFKGEIQKAWGDLTGDELEQTKGNIQSIKGLIQQKYAHSDQDVSTKLDKMARKFGVEAKEAAVNTSDKIKKALKKNDTTKTY